MVRVRERFYYSILVFLLALLACNIPAFNSEAREKMSSSNSTTTNTPQAAATEGGATQDTTRVAETVIAQISQTAVPLTPSSTVTMSVATPIGPQVCNWAGFISDISYPDDSLVTTGQKFVKTWEMKNLGTCTWTPKYVLIFAQGDKMEAPDEVKFTSVNVPPNGFANVSVDLEAPATPGVYQGFFKMKAGDGSTFGIGPQANGSFWVRVQAVSNNPSQTGEPAPDVDLRSSSFSIAPASVPLGTAVTVAFTLRNKGNTASGHFKVAWRSGEGGVNPQCTWDVPALSSGETIGPLSCSYTYKKTGMYNSQLILDDGDEITETNETNNIEIAVVKIYE